MKVKLNKSLLHRATEENNSSTDSHCMPRCGWNYYGSIVTHDHKPKHQQQVCDIIAICVVIFVIIFVIFMHIPTPTSFLQFLVMGVQSNTCDTGPVHNFSHNVAELHCKSYIFPHTWEGLSESAVDFMDGGYSIDIKREHNSGGGGKWTILDH